MQTILSPFNLEAKATGVFEKQICYLLLDDVNSKSVHPQELIKHVFLENKTPICFAKRVFSLMIVQKIKKMPPLDLDKFNPILDFKKTPLNSWVEDLFFTGLRLYLTNSVAELIKFLDQVRAERDFISESSFILFILVLATLSDSEDLLSYAKKQASDFLYRSQHLYFRNLYSSSQELVATKEPFIHAFLITLFFKEEFGGEILSKLGDYFSRMTKKSEDDENVYFYDALIAHYVMSLEPISLPVETSLFQTNYIEASTHKSTSLALGSFCFSELYVPAFGFADVKRAEQEFFFFNPLFSSVEKNSLTTAELIVSLGKSFESFCALDLFDFVEKFELIAHLEGVCSQKFCLFLRAHSIKCKDKVIKKESLEQFSGLCDSFFIEQGNKSFCASLNCPMDVEVKPLAGGAYFWTADFLITFSLTKKKRKLNLSLVECLGSP